MRIGLRRVAAPVLACVAVFAAALLAMPATRAQVHRIARVAGIAHVQSPVRPNEPLRAMRYTALDGSGIAFGPQQHGTYVFNVFTSWCPSCREELPAFARVAARLQPRGVHVVGIDQGESSATVAAFAASKGVRYPVVIDSDRTSNAVLGANVIPTTVIVRDGVVRAVWSGPISANDLETFVTRAL